MTSDGEKQIVLRTAKAAPESVLHLRVGGEVPGPEEIQELMDLLKATAYLRAYVEWFDPTTGDYRILLVGAL